MTRRHTIKNTLKTSLWLGCLAFGGLTGCGDSPLAEDGSGSAQTDIGQTTSALEQRLADHEYTFRFDAKDALETRAKVLKVDRITEPGFLYREATLRHADTQIDVFVEGDEESNLLITAANEFGTQYELELTETEANIKIQHPDGVQHLTLFDQRGLDASLTKLSNDPSYTRKGPWQDDSVHSMMLSFVAHEAEADPSLSAAAHRLERVTRAMAERLSGDRSAKRNARTRKTASRRALFSGATRGDDQMPINEDERPLECENPIVKKWSVGEPVDLGAGPVNLSVIPVRVKGSSLCDQRFGQIDQGGTNTLSSRSRNANDGECNDDYDKVYELTGKIEAKATHNRCCWADGQNDIAEAAKLNIDVFGYTLNIPGVPTVKADMSSQASATLRAQIKICHTDNLIFSDSAYGVSEIWQGSARIR